MTPKRTADLNLLLTVTAVLFVLAEFGLGGCRPKKTEQMSEDTGLSASKGETHDHRSTDDSSWDFGYRHVFWQIKENPDSILPWNLPKDSIPDSTGIAGLYDKYEDHVQFVMDSLFESILKRHKGDREMLRNMKKSQAAWIAYREAELKAIINPTLHGSWEAVRECYSQYWLALTRERIAELLMWTSHPKEVSTGQNICNTFDSQNSNTDTIVFH